MMRLNIECSIKPKKLSHVVCFIAFSVENNFEIISEMALTDPDSYNWLFHQKLIHSNSNFLPKLDKVDKSFYADYSNGIINRQNGKIAESLSCFRSLLKKEPTSEIQ